MNRIGMRSCPIGPLMLLMGFVLGALLIGLSPAGAATFSVSKLSDSNDGICDSDCSLREAIMASNAATGADSITLVSLEGTVVLDSALPIITDSVSIVGSVRLGGDRQPDTEITRNPGKPAFRIFDMALGSTLELDGLTVSNGAASKGAGIHNNGGTLKVIRCVLQNNIASDEGGAIHNNGLNGIATATISGSIFKNNRANSNTGGGFFNDARDASAQAFFTHCTFEGNQAARGGGLANYGPFDAATVNLSNCTFSSNIATIDGGAVITDSGFVAGNATTLINFCTFSNNAVSPSTPNAGGAIRSVASGLARLKHTILSNNDLGVDSFGGTIESQGFNLSSGSGNGFLNATGDLVNTNPLLGPLADNGGFTRTHALSENSPAVNSGDPLYYSNGSDQRGYYRLVGSRVDIGAYELQKGLSLVVTKTADTDDGTCDTDCSLREALQLANQTRGDHTISFASNIMGTISITGRPLVAYENVHVKGPGARRLTVRRGAGTGSVFYVTSIVTISGLTISDGIEPADQTDQESYGGAIEADRGFLVVRNCIFSNNTARYGGAIYTQGQLLAENCTFIGNRAVFGGAINFRTSLYSTSVLRQCTFSGNEAISRGAGGAIYNGLVSPDDSKLVLEHCTITNNHLELPERSAGIYSYTWITISNSIITGNTAYDGTPSDVHEQNSSEAPNVIQSGGYNLIGAGSAVVNFNNNDQTGVTDAMLFPLGDYGGSTPTHALRFGSPAINAGNPNFAPPPAFDQRDIGFPRVRNGRLDVGAYEYEIPLALTISDVIVTEGDSATTNASFEVRLSIPSTQTVTVNAIPYNGSAKAPADYTSGGVRLSFAPGEVSKTFSVPIKDDLLDEVDETFYVLLSSPVNATIARGRGIGTIQDNDAAPSISIEDLSIGEGNEGQRVAAFRLKLSAPSGQLVKVSYVTTNTTTNGVTNAATAGSDYVAVAPTQVAFTTGQTVTLARVLINGDTFYEPDETLLVNLTNSLNATISDAQALGTILNDDTAPSLSVNDVTISEGNTGAKSLTFTVTLSKAGNQSVSVNYASADGTAKAASDYVTKSGLLTFTPGGALTQTISIVINGDTMVESDETLFLFLSGATNASIGRARAIGTIINDDSSG